MGRLKGLVLWHNTGDIPKRLIERLFQCLPALKLEFWLEHPQQLDMMISGCTGGIRFFDYVIMKLQAEGKVLPNDGNPAQSEKGDKHYIVPLSGNVLRLSEWLSQQKGGKHGFLIFEDRGEIYSPP